MHTAQTTYHRIFFSNVTNRTLLEELAQNLGMEATEDVDVFDLIQSEGEGTIVFSALSDSFPERLLKVGCRDAYDMVFDEVITAYKKMAEDQNTQLISSLFEVSRYQTGVEDTDIDCDELFDLLSVLGDSHFKVVAVYTQWAMSSSKAVFGAHAGGTRLTTRHFSVPCQISPDEIAGVVESIDNEVGGFFADTFVMPLLNGVRNPLVRSSAVRAICNYVNNPLTLPSSE